MTPRTPVVPAASKSKLTLRSTTPDQGVWHAQPPPEDDSAQPTRWNDEADRAAFYTLYEKLMQR